MIAYRLNIKLAHFYELGDALAGGLPELRLDTDVRRLCRETAALMGQMAFRSDNVLLGRNGFSNQEQTVGVCARVLNKDLQTIGKVLKDHPQRDRLDDLLKRLLNTCAADAVLEEIEEEELP